MNVNEALGKNGGRIAATLEQEPWLRAFWRVRLPSLEKQQNDLNATMFSEFEKMGLGKPARNDRLPHLSPLGGSLGSAAQARHVSACLKTCKALQRQAEDAHHAAKSVHEEVTAALSDRGAADLTSATEHAGNLVNQLRRRMQLDEQLEQLSRNEKELHDQAQGLLEKQVPTGNTTLLLGLIFVVGVLILSLGLLGVTVWSGMSLDARGRRASHRGRRSPLPIRRTPRERHAA